MRKRTRNSICSMLLSLIMLSTYCMQAFAMPQQNDISSEIVQLEGDVVQLDCEVVGYNEEYQIVPYATAFADASITFSFGEEGMHISICTGMNGIASVVGVKNIEVHRKRLIGWEVVAVADGGEVYNTTTALTTMVYTGAVEGEKYRVSCTHYGDVEGYREMDSQTDWITCHY